jgi:hypothetical protein
VNIVIRSLKLDKCCIDAVNESFRTGHVRGVDGRHGAVEMMFLKTYAR